MNHPLVIKLHKTTVITGNIVRITDEAVTKVQEVQRVNGLSATQFISQLILHYADEIVFEEI